MEAYLFFLSPSIPSHTKHQLRCFYYLLLRKRNMVLVGSLCLQFSLCAAFRSTLLGDSSAPTGLLLRYWATDPCLLNSAQTLWPEIQHPSQFGFIFLCRSISRTFLTNTLHCGQSGWGSICCLPPGSPSNHPPPGRFTSTESVHCWNLICPLHPDFKYSLECYFLPQCFLNPPFPHYWPKSLPCSKAPNGTCSRNRALPILFCTLAIWVSKAFPPAGCKLLEAGDCGQGQGGFPAVSTLMGLRM